MMEILYQGNAPLASNVAEITAIYRNNRILIFEGIPGKRLLQTIEPETESWVHFLKFVKGTLNTATPKIPGLRGINAAILRLAVKP